MNTLRVHLFCLAALAAERGSAADLALLAPDEADRLGRAKSPTRRLELLHGRAALRRLLACYAGVAEQAVVLQADAYGKPHAQVGDAPLGWAFNLSHAAGRLAIAIGPAGTAVGVDLEREDPALAGDVDAIAGRHFAHAEAMLLANTPRDVRLGAFVRLWTMKEAVLKAAGTGLGAPLDAVRVAGAGAWPKVWLHGRRWPGGVRHRRLDAGWHLAVASHPCLARIVCMPYANLLGREGAFRL